MLTNLDRKIITRICEKRLYAAATNKIIATLEGDATYEKLGKITEMSYEVYTDFVAFNEFLDELETKPKKHEDTIGLIDEFYARRKAGIKEEENN